MRKKPGELETLVFGFLQENGEISTYTMAHLSSRNSLRKVINKFRSLGLIHISRWFRHPKNGGWVPSYKPGNGKDVKKPAFYSEEETARRQTASYRRYRRKNKEALAARRRKLPKGAPRGYVKTKMIELFKSGEEMTTKQAAQKTGGDRSAAQRNIKALRKNLYVCDWQWSGSRYVAVYAWKNYGDEDMPRPKMQKAKAVVQQWGWLYGAARA